MEKRVMGNTGMKVSILGFGGAEIGFEQASQGDVESLLNEAIDQGLNVIDTAECYMNSEEMIGKAISGRRKDFYLFTKCGHGDDPTMPAWTAPEVEKSIEKSLRRLKTDYLDLIQLHSCSKKILEQGEVIEVLKKAKEAGKTRFIGYSGDGEDALYAIETGEFDTVLCYHDYHPCKKLAAEHVVPAATANDMGIVIATPLAGGIFVEGKEQYEAVEQWFEEEDRPRVWGILEEMKRENSTLPQSAFRWILGDNRVSTVSSGSSNTAEWDEVVAAADMEVLRLSV